MTESLKCQIHGNNVTWWYSYNFSFRVQSVPFRLQNCKPLNLYLGKPQSKAMPQYMQLESWWRRQSAVTHWSLWKIIINIIGNPCWTPLCTYTLEISLIYWQEAALNLSAWEQNLSLTLFRRNLDLKDAMLDISYSGIIP